MATYTDLNANFKMSATDQSCTTVGIETVKNSLERLLMTGKGEVPFNREYGTTLKSLLFETNLDPSDICNYLYIDITTWEPRVRLNPADIEISRIDRNSFLVSCVFTVIGVNGNPQTITKVISNG